MNSEAFSYFNRSILELEDFDQISDYEVKEKDSEQLNYSIL